MICQVYRLARSTVYATASSSAEAVPQKRGPKTAWSDAVLLEALHGVLAKCPFYGEGYRKVRTRLAHRGIHVSRKRVLRLMRAHGLLASSSSISPLLLVKGGENSMTTCGDYWMTADTWDRPMAIPRMMARSSPTLRM